MPMSTITKEQLELAELLCIVGYLVFAWVQRRQQPLTIIFFSVAGGMLAIDLGVFGCVRPPYVWALLNVHVIAAAGIGIYEKILKKSVRLVVRKVLVMLFLLGD